MWSKLSTMALNDAISMMDDVYSSFDNEDPAVYVLECSLDGSPEDVRTQAGEYWGTGDRVEFDSVRRVNARAEMTHTEMYVERDGREYPFWVEMAIAADQVYYVGTVRAGRLFERMKEHFIDDVDSAQAFTVMQPEEVVALRNVNEDEIATQVEKEIAQDYFDVDVAWNAHFTREDVKRFARYG